MLSRNQAFEIAKKNLKNKNLLRHCLAVEAAMEALCKHFGQTHDIDRWQIVGLLHDADWEETQNEYGQHTKKTIEWLKEAGEEDKVITEAILSHNFEYNGFRQPASTLEWSLYTCDELTGLIVATALVRPDKKLASVTVESVMKKFPIPSFAAGADREKIKICEEKLSIKLPDFIAIVLSSMQRISDDLGL